MKRWIIWVGVLLFLGACASSRLTPEGKKAKETAVSQKVRNAVDSLKFEAEITYMYPRRGPSKVLDAGWSVRVSGDTLYSYLPYFGRAYHVPYGGGKGLNFSAPLQSHRVTEDKKGRRIVVLETRNDEDQYRYTFQIDRDGSLTLDVRSGEREGISYSGSLTLK